MPGAELLRIHDYDNDDFCLDWIVEDMIDAIDTGLEDLHLKPVEVPPDLKPVQDQSTPFHTAFYSQFERWLRREYEGFVKRIIAPLIPEPFLYQNVPTFRVHLPGNVAVGEFHKDADYGHPEGERVVWVPLTQAQNTNACLFRAGGQLIPINCRPGQFWIGNTRDNEHGNVRNEEGFTRVSFDFRVLPKRLYDPAYQGRSVARGLPFVIGGYWKE